LINKAPIPKSHPATTPPEIQDIVIHMRKKCHFGPERISIYLQRYRPDIKISTLTIYRTLRRNGLNRLPRKTTRRALNTKRYEKQVPGYPIQVDVTFLSFINKDNRKIKRFQYTAFDDATRIRAMKIYPKHNCNRWPTDDRSTAKTPPLPFIAWQDRHVSSSTTRASLDASVAGRSSPDGYVGQDGTS